MGIKIKVDIEPMDYSIDNLIVQIEGIRDEISEEEEIPIKSVLDYLDKLCEIIAILYEDHKIYVTRHNRVSQTVNNLTGMKVAKEDIEEFMKDGSIISNNREDIYS